MDNALISERFSRLSTPNVADGCIRAGVPVRCAPAGTRAVIEGARLAGRVLPARHVGSVDIFLEAYENAGHGDVLVVDNAGRTDESCVGDLAVLEARSADVAGVVIWGLHRDTDDIRSIGLPVFSLGSLSTGPLSVGERPHGALESARVGEWVVTRDDVVLGDADGVLFVPAAALEAVFDHAEGIRRTEAAQADKIRSGVTLREQVRFGGYLAARELDPSLTFRQHLASIGGAIEV